ncbi:C1 family peptidase [Planctellipticum variicoloris]|uniref:C1 family peptidase n=1 Tax=Planctellipticum variicoloris TaxID=3064265 RepID=UPI003013910E|nr:C1 family peptidase [Planctomycetaceae bacterium SH412]
MVKKHSPGKSVRLRAKSVSGKRSSGTRRKAGSAAGSVGITGRRFDARPDPIDFRDRLYEPTLIEVPQEVSLKAYQKLKVPILDQGQEGACTGFGLATVVHYLLRKRKVRPDSRRVSPRMLYEMARRYDEWPGEKYDGSSARGAIKGWHKHGVCAEPLWPYRAGAVSEPLTADRARNAAERPLGAYLRVNHLDLTAMHAAIAEVGVLYVTANVHQGWDAIDSEGSIPFDEDPKWIGGHAFALVAYDDRGFWLQNSWGVDWGNGGFARISYDDWLVAGTDAWVARLGVPVQLRQTAGVAAANSDAAGNALGNISHIVRPHIVSVGNNGSFRTSGTYGTSREEVAELIDQEIPKVLKSWKKPRLLLYTHGGLTPESSAVQRVADYRQFLRDHEIYPLMFSWKTDYWTTITNVLTDAFKRRTAGGAISAAKNFLLDRVDDGLEPLARQLSGMTVWEEMKQNALLASQADDGAARFVADKVAELLNQIPQLEVHVAGHSAGGIFNAPLIRYLCSSGEVWKDSQGAAVNGLGLNVKTLTLWAPACTVRLFAEMYAPCLEAGKIGRCRVFTLSDEVEQDDNCAKIYNKSLLYLVSNAFEEFVRLPWFRPHGEALLGLAKSFGIKPKDLLDGYGLPLVEPGQVTELRQALERLQTLAKQGTVEWIASPTGAGQAPGAASGATHHGDFDDDRLTLESLLATILGARQHAVEAAAHPPVGSPSPESSNFVFSPSASKMAQRRKELSR